MIFFHRIDITLIIIQLNQPLVVAVRSLKRELLVVGLVVVLSGHRLPLDSAELVVASVLRLAVDSGRRPVLGLEHKLEAPLGVLVVVALGLLSHKVGLVPNLVVLVVLVVSVLSLEDLVLVQVEALAQQAQASVLSLEGLVLVQVVALALALAVDLVSSSSRVLVVSRWVASVLRLAAASANNKEDLVPLVAKMLVPSEHLEEAPLRSEMGLRLPTTCISESQCMLKSTLISMAT